MGMQSVQNHAVNSKVTDDTGQPVCRSAGHYSSVNIWQNLLMSDMFRTRQVLKNLALFMLFHVSI